MLSCYKLNQTQKRYGKQNLLAALAQWSARPRHQNFEVKETAMARRPVGVVSPNAVGNCRHQINKESSVEKLGLCSVVVGERSAGTEIAGGFDELKTTAQKAGRRTRRAAMACRGASGVMAKYPDYYRGCALLVASPDGRRRYFSGTGGRGGATRLFPHTPEFGNGYGFPKSSTSSDPAKP